MQNNQQDPAMEATLDQLRQAVVTTYGEERAAEHDVQAALEATASAIWRVMLEKLDPMDAEPLAHV